jgi:hypothetical protein
MGTRSTIKFYSDNEFMTAIYQQYDGYLKGGVGEELADFLAKTTIVNGISMGNNSGKANGAGCLVAQYIARHKKSIGGLYITTESDTQEYNYTVYFAVATGMFGVESCIKITVDYVNYKDEKTPIYDGDLIGFCELCKRGESEDN